MLVDLLSVLFSRVLQCYLTDTRVAARRLVLLENCELSTHNAIGLGLLSLTSLSRRNHVSFDVEPNL